MKATLSSQAQALLRNGATTERLAEQALATMQDGQSADAQSAIALSIFRNVNAQAREAAKGDGARSTDPLSKRSTSAFKKPYAAGDTVDVNA